MTIRMQNRIMAITMMVAAVVLVITSCGCAEQPPKGHLVTETYIVTHEDSVGLDVIAYKFMAKSSSRYRDVRDFREGIIQENWDAVFYDREPGRIYPGDRLQISYWVSD